MNLRDRLRVIGDEIARNVRYGAYVVRHRHYVIEAGLRLGAPLWALLVHDWSKFLPDEWGPYRDRFYPRRGQTPAEAVAALERFNAATMIHFRRAPHHWQYWMTGNMSGVLTVTPMPERFAREMVADWIGAARAQGNAPVAVWWKEKRARIQLDYRTRELVDRLVAQAEREAIG